MPFEKNVFVNCPFDEEYRPLLEAILFTTLYLGFEPLLSQTISSGHVRVNQIKLHIRNSRFAIHDLSRCRSLKKNELPRFNMPYELGLDIGCMEFGGDHLQTKRSLILETDRYHYQKVLSDIAGQDIEHHNDQPTMVIQKVRNWFSNNYEGQEILPGPWKIWIAFNDFRTDLEKNMINAYAVEDIEQMPVSDFIRFARRWIMRKYPTNSLLRITCLCRKLHNCVVGKTSPKPFLDKNSFSLPMDFEIGNILIQQHYFFF